MTEQDYEERYEPRPLALDVARAALHHEFGRWAGRGFVDAVERFEAAVRANERAGATRAALLREIADEQEATATTDSIQRRRSLATARRLLAFKLRSEADEARP